jgi:hypothetical protein
MGAESWGGKVPNRRVSENFEGWYLKPRLVWNGPYFFLLLACVLNEVRVCVTGFDFEATPCGGAHFSFARRVKTRKIMGKSPNFHV